MVKKLKWNLVLMSVLYLGLGIFLVMKPGTALNIVCYALGGVVLACAAVQLIRYFVVERGVFQSQLTLISGIICLALGAFLLLRSDIVGRLLPLPEALRHTAETAPEPLHAQYTALADGITDSERPFCEQWAAAIRALDMLTPAARAALLTLGAQLGKYDAQLQRQALDACIASLQSISAALQDDVRRRGKLLCGLGATLGLLAAVALL